MEQPPGSQRRSDHELSPSQSRSGRSAANYSSDSFESTIDEPSWDYESDPFESCTDRSTPDYESDSSESFTNGLSQNYESDTFESFSQVNSHETSFSETTSIPLEAVEEVPGRNDPENGLIKKWIAILGNRKLQSANSSRPAHSSVAQPNHTGIESSPLLSYCSVKIQHLCQQPTITREKKPHPRQQHRSSKERHPSCSIPGVIMNRLQMQSVKETMKQVTQAKMHDPATCPDCIQKQAELAQSQFIRTRRTKLQADLMQLQLEEYSYKNDLITRIGEIHRSLPKPSDDRSAIWQRLYASVKT